MRISSEIRTSAVHSSLSTPFVLLSCISYHLISSTLCFQISSDMSPSLFSRPQKWPVKRGKQKHIHISQISCIQKQGECLLFPSDINEVVNWTEEQYRTPILSAFFCSFAQVLLAKNGLLQLSAEGWQHKSLPLTSSPDASKVQKPSVHHQLRLRGRNNS